MSVLITYQGLAGAATVSQDVPIGAYLQSYDLEAAGGRGFARWTVDRERAIHFADAAAAMKCWQAVPKALPTRPDGKPNRPLTAFNVSFITVE